MRPIKKYVPVLTVTVLLLTAAVFGYSAGGSKPAVPVRILFKNNGGTIIFSHLVHHRDYRVDCASCHHEGTAFAVTAQASSGMGEALPCGSCHPTEFNQDYMESHTQLFPDKQSCVKCHHTEYTSTIFDHEAHKGYGDCSSCHHGKEIEPVPQKCANCHQGEGEALLSMRQAAHQRCASCHQDMFDKGLSGCRSCHVAADMTKYEGDYTTCGNCHEKDVRELVRPRTQAFHDQCMSCHEERGAGPYGPDSCAKCHTR